MHARLQTEFALATHDTGTLLSVCFFFKKRTFTITEIFHIRMNTHCENKHMEQQILLPKFQRLSKSLKITIIIR